MPLMTKAMNWIRLARCPWSRRPPGPRAPPARRARTRNCAGGRTRTPPPRAGSRDRGLDAHRHDEAVDAAGQHRRVERDDSRDEDQREARERHPVAFEPQEGRGDERGGKPAADRRGRERDVERDAEMAHHLRREEAADGGEHHGGEAQDARRENRIGAEREERIDEREDDGAAVGRPEVEERVHPSGPQEAGAAEQPARPHDQEDQQQRIGDAVAHARRDVLARRRPR